MASAALVSSVGADQGKLGIELERQRGAGRDGDPQHGRHLAHQLAQIHGLDDEPALPRVGQHLLTQIRRPAGRDLDLVDVGRGRRRRRQLHRRQLGVAQHGDQDVVEVVRDASGQHTEALQLLRLLHPLLELLALGDVAQHRLPGDRAVGVVDRRVHHVVPALILGALHLPAHRLALLYALVLAPGADVVHAVQHVVTRLAGGVAARALDEALVHELHPVVRGADVDQAVEGLHDGPVAGLALAQRPLRLLALGDVPDHGQDHAPARQGKQPGVDLHRDAEALARDVDALEGGMSLVDQRLDHRRHPLGGLLGVDVQGRQGQQLVPGVAHLLAGHGVDVDEQSRDAVLVQLVEVDRVSGGVEDGPQTLLAVGQLPQPLA